MKAVAAAASTCVFLVPRGGGGGGGGGFRVHHPGKCVFERRHCLTVICPFDGGGSGDMLNRDIRAPPVHDRNLTASQSTSARARACVGVEKEVVKGSSNHPGTVNQAAEGYGGGGVGEIINRGLYAACRRRSFPDFVSCRSAICKHQRERI